MSTSGSTRPGVAPKSGRSAGLMSPPGVPSSSASIARPSISSSLATNERRPSSAASTSSRGGPSRRGGESAYAHDSSSSSSAARRRRLEDLVLATVPAARPRRSEVDQRRMDERNAIRADMIDVVESSLAGASFDEASAASDQNQIVSQLKRKLSRYDPDGAQGSSVRLESVLSKLKRQPDMTRNLNGLLQLIDGLSFTSKLTTYSPESGNVPRSASSLLQVPEGRQIRRSSSREEEHEARRASASDRSRAATPLQIASPASENVAYDKFDDPDVRSEHVNAANALGEQDLNVPKAKLLERWRSRKGISLIPEGELLHDVIYLLQGINGKHVGFEDAIVPASNEVGDTREAEKFVKVRYFGNAERRITEPTKQLVHQIVELGRLYKRIDDFQRQRSHEQTSGLIMQSFCHFLSVELTDYYRLIAILESQMKQQQHQQTQTQTEQSADRGKAGLSLRRVAVWTQDVLLRMRLISTLIESCQEAHGGAIVSLIHSYTFHGDPLIQKFTAEILDHVAKPFFHMLSLWIFEGELQDPFEEFFVEANKDLKAAWTPVSDGKAEDGSSALYMSTSQDNVAPPSSLWQNQFRFRPEMLPSFLDENFGKKIFSAGKSLNFIRFSCGDADWVTTNMALQHDKRMPLRYANLPRLERTIDEAYASASTRLLDIFLGKFKLMSHLRALKDYLMLTKGDFTDLLMESIGPSLDKPASSLFRHNLTASLETSIRGSNSQFDDMDIVGRLDARILDFSEGDLGWEGFTLEYRVDEPVSTVLDNHSMLGYQVIFNHLWKMKRVELTLGRGWERLLLAANLLRRAQPRTIKRSTIARRGGSAASLEATDDKGEPDNKAELGLIRIAHEALGHLSEQVHFVKQMQGFISLEVIEYSWNDLTQLFASHTAKRRLIDLDELITSHRAYLNALIAKIMLRGSSAGSGTKRSDQLAQEVKMTLDTMLAFAGAIEELARLINDEIARKGLSAGQPAQGSSASSRPHTPFEQAKRDTSAPSSLENIRSRLTTNHAKFQSSTQTIIAKLEKHSNLVVRDLATRLNFNSFYNTAAHQANASTSGAQNRRGGGGQTSVASG